MARDWRRLVLAATAAAAVATVCTMRAESQAPAEAQNEEAPAKAPPKKKKQDPVEAQRTINAALKQLEAGKADQAVTALSTTLSGGNLPPAIMAKALLYRGIAYRQQKKPAQAIADLTSALWLKGGLGDSDRKDALQQRASAYQEAGLTETGEAIAPAVPPSVAHAASPSQATTRTASASKTWGADTSSQPNWPAPAQAAPAQTSQQSSGWNFFENLFGGPSPAPAPKPAPPAPAPAPTAMAPPPVAAAPVERPEPPSVVRLQPEARAAATSGWSNSTEVQARTPAPAPVVTGALPPAKAEGRFRIQVGIVRTQGEADALVAKIKQEHGPLLASRETEIDQTVVGNMGSFYRVRVGPFATQQETNVICARLKGTGLDCLVLTQ